MNILPVLGLIFGVMIVELLILLISKVIDEEFHAGICVVLNGIIVWFLLMILNGLW